MKKVSVLILFFHLFFLVSGQIIHIPGDYTKIQEGIDAANSGDTVLVWPGTYYENLIINDKSIILGSLTLTTQDKKYASQTIIDGSSDSATCVAIVYCDDYVELNGFTICNGWGFWGSYPAGGGVHFRYASNACVKNCIVNNNVTSISGGGMNIDRSYVYVAATNIFDNHAHRGGGGIYVLKGELEFDPVNRCNVYLNYAATGTDIFHVDDSSYSRINVIVDTFTVQSPDYYYLYDYKDVGNPLNYDIRNHKIATVNQNLYVSNNGNNSNSGLYPREALKDIYFALLKMESDSITPDTIHVENGSYSYDSGEKYPLSLKRDVSIRGENRYFTILDANKRTRILNGIAYADNYKISSLTLQKGKGNNDGLQLRGAFYLNRNRNVIFEDLLVTENEGYYASGGEAISCNLIEFRNIDFVNNFGGRALKLGHFYSELDTNIAKVINCRFTENIANEDDEYPTGGGIHVTTNTDDTSRNFTCYVVNCLFENNNGDHVTSLTVGRNSKVYLVSSTLSDNLSDYTPNIWVSTNSTLTIYNSILWGNSSWEIEGQQGLEDTSRLIIYNSLIQNGKEGIGGNLDSNHLYYDESNILTDPSFLYRWDHPYQIDYRSPCIDVGTLNLPDFIDLPEFDLAGNPRIVGGSIDMGAYEWNPTVGTDSYQEDPIKEYEFISLHIAPNPFTSSTTISYNLQQPTTIQIAIFNHLGIQVDFIQQNQSQGKQQISWDASAQPSGVYYFRLQAGEQVTNGKLLLVK